MTSASTLTAGDFLREHGVRLRPGFEGVPYLPLVRLALGNPGYFNAIRSAVTAANRNILQMSLQEIEDFIRDRERDTLEAIGAMHNNSCPMFRPPTVDFATVLTYPITIQIPDPSYIAGAPGIASPGSGAIQDRRGPVQAGPSPSSTVSTRIPGHHIVAPVGRHVVSPSHAGPYTTQAASDTFQPEIADSGPNEDDQFLPRELLLEGFVNLLGQQNGGFNGDEQSQVKEAIHLDVDRLRSAIFQMLHVRTSCPDIWVFARKRLQYRLQVFQESPEYKHEPKYEATLDHFVGLVRSLDTRLGEFDEVDAMKGLFFKVVAMAVDQHVPSALNKAAVGAG